MNISENDRRLSRPLQEHRLKTFHVYGQGAGPDGAGPDGISSGFAWIKVDTGKKQVAWVEEGWTKEQAEYRGLIAALEYVGGGSTVRIWMDSPLVCVQFNYPLLIHDPLINALLCKACNLELDKDLHVETRSISRKRNLAAELFAARW